MSTNSNSSLGNFSLWEEIERRLKIIDKENQRSIEYIIDLMNYITRNIYKNHKYYWKLIPQEKKYFLKIITKSTINGCYEDDVKKWNEQTFRTHFNTNKRNEKKQIKKIKNQYNLNSLPIQTYQKKTLKQFKKILHQRKFDLIHRKESKQGMINPNNKNLIIKLGYGAIKEEISKHRHKIGRASC